MLKISLINTLPYDVIINHILPYTYEVKPKRHLTDIRSFYTDYRLLENTYMFDYNTSVLLYDLLKFCNSTRDQIYILSDYFECVLRKNFTLSSRNSGDLQLFAFKQYFRDLYENQNKKIKFLLGLLTPRERTLFINKFILVDYEDYDNRI